MSEGRLALPSTRKKGFSLIGTTLLWTSFLGCSKHQIFPITTSALPGGKRPGQAEWGPWLWVQVWAYMLNLLGFLLFDVANHEFSGELRTKRMEVELQEMKALWSTARPPPSPSDAWSSEALGRRREAQGSFFSKAAVPRQRSKPLLVSGRESTHLQSNKQWGLGWEFHVDLRDSDHCRSEFLPSAFYSKDDAQHFLSNYPQQTKGK